MLLVDRLNEVHDGRAFSVSRRAPRRCAFSNRVRVRCQRTHLATKARRRRDVHIGMYAVATLGPFAHDYRPRAAATKNQPILPARSEILFGKSFLFVFLF